MMIIFAPNWYITDPDIYEVTYGVMRLLLFLLPNNLPAAKRDGIKKSECIGHL